MEAIHMPSTKMILQPFATVMPMFASLVSVREASARPLVALTTRMVNNHLLQCMYQAPTLKSHLVLSGRLYRLSVSRQEVPVIVTLDVSSTLAVLVSQRLTTRRRHTELQKVPSPVAV